MFRNTCAGILSTNQTRRPTSAHRHGLGTLAVAWAAVPSMAVAASLLALPAAAADLELQIQFNLVLDRVSPYPFSGINNRYAATVTFSGKNRVSEQLTRLAEARVGQKLSKEDTTLGREGKRAKWAVIGPQTIRGTLAWGIDSVLLITVEVADNSSSCALDLRLLPPSGKTEFASYRASDPHQIAIFRNERFTEAACTVGHTQ